MRFGKEVEDMSGNSIGVGSGVFYFDEDLEATVTDVNEDGTIDIEGQRMHSDNQDADWVVFRGIDADLVELETP